MIEQFDKDLKELLKLQMLLNVIKKDNLVQLDYLLKQIETILKKYVNVLE